MYVILKNVEKTSIFIDFLWICIEKWQFLEKLANGRTQGGNPESLVWLNSYIVKVTSVQLSQICPLASSCADKKLQAFVSWKTLDETD